MNSRLPCPRRKSSQSSLAARLPWKPANVLWKPPRITLPSPTAVPSLLAGDLAFTVLKKAVGFEEPNEECPRSALNIHRNVADQTDGTFQVPSTDRGLGYFTPSPPS